MPVRDEPTTQVIQNPAPIEDVQMVLNESAGTVTYSIGLTKNLGNYESLRLESSITVPIGATDEELEKADATLVKAREKCLARLGADISDVTSQLT